MILQKDNKPVTALRLLEEAMRGDAGLCMEGDPSRVPLLFLRADAYHAMSLLSVKAACKLVRNCLVSSNLTCAAVTL